MRKKLFRDVRTTVIAVAVASLVFAAPAAAIVANADKVDNKHAVSAGATKKARAGKLVATSRGGYLPNNIVRKATNADRLDGLNSTAFAKATGKTGVLYGSGQWVDTDEDGVDDFIAAFAECPAGTQLTGGGVEDYTSDGVTFHNAPIDGRTWAVAVAAGEGQVAGDVGAYAVCYNPNGAVAGSLPRQAPGVDSTDAFLQRMAGAATGRG